MNFIDIYLTQHESDNVLKILNFPKINLKSFVQTDFFEQKCYTYKNLQRLVSRNRNQYKKIKRKDTYFINNFLINKVVIKDINPLCFPIINTYNDTISLKIIKYHNQSNNINLYVIEEVSENTKINYIRIDNKDYLQKDLENLINHITKQ
jgi:hypothetical protein